MLTKLCEALSHFTGNEILSDSMDFSYRFRSSQRIKKCYDDDEWNEDEFDDDAEYESMQYLGVESIERLDPDTKEIFKWRPFFSSKSYQVNQF